MRGTVKDYCQSIAVQILDKLKSAGFKAVIAGGFARDLYEDRTPRDIDIYVESSKDDYRFLNFITGDNDYRAFPKGAKFYQGLNNLIEVYETYRNVMSGGFTVQFIEVDTDDIAKWVSDSFDLSNCCILYDGFNFTKLDRYLKYEETGIIELSNTLDDNQKKYSIKKHVFKIINRNPDKKFNLNVTLKQLSEYISNLSYSYEIHPRTKIHEAMDCYMISGTDFFLKRKNIEIPF